MKVNKHDVVKTTLSENPVVVTRLDTYVDTVWVKPYSTSFGIIAAKEISRSSIIKNLGKVDLEVIAGFKPGDIISPMYKMQSHGYKFHGFERLQVVELGRINIGRVTVKVVDLTTHRYKTIFADGFKKTGERIEQEDTYEVY